VFGNRRYGWKLGGALALVLALGALSGARGSLVNPAPWRCLAQPERWDGARIWIPAARVASADAEGFVLETEGLPFRVAGRAEVRPGDTVGVAGTFEAAGPRLRLGEWRRIGPLGGTRWIAEAVSIVVLALVAANFFRRFRFRPGAADVEGDA